MIIKAIKQYIIKNNLSKSNLDELTLIAHHYSNTKNYFFSRYSGINSFMIIHNHRKEIRDKIVNQINSNSYIYNFNLPARYWKLALDEAISNIKSNWSNTINRTKDNIKNNSIINLSDHDKHYLFHILKNRELLFNVLTHKKIDIPDRVNYSDINIKRLNNLLCRLIRENKSNISKVKNKNIFSLDNGMYRYTGNSTILIQSLKKGERIALKINNNKNQPFNKTVRVKITKKHIELHSYIEIKEREIKGKDIDIDNTEINNEDKYIIGVDKNYENVIASSNGFIYGEGSNKLYNSYTDYVIESKRNKNKLKSMVYELEKKGGLSDRENKKVENIKKNNLGDKKFKENVRKKKEEIKSMVNHSINLFLENEKPKEIIVEDLTFRVKKSNKNNISKKGKHKLNQWIKGYIDERIKYKSSLYGIEITEINAAGTSQICGECGHFEGKRSDSDKFNCSRCENRGLSAHLNSAKAIKGRKYDNEIKLKMRPDIVFRILNARNKKRLLDNKLTGTTKAQENNKIIDFDINNEIIQSECELS